MYIEIIILALLCAGSPRRQKESSDGKSKSDAMDTVTMHTISDLVKSVTFG